MQYNSIQSELHNAIISRSLPFISVTGDAGTGKTFTILTSLIRLAQQDPDFSALVLAPTHQALKVLKSMAGEFADLLTFSTVASALGKFGFLSSTSSDIIFSRSVNFSKSVIGASVIYVDEFSMVSENDALALFNFVSQFPDRHFIVSGDPLQLSPVLDSSHDLLLNPTFHLTQQVRFSHSPSLLSFCSSLRDKDSWWHLLSQPPVGDGVFSFDSFDSLFERAKALPLDSVLFLSYTNAHAFSSGSSLRSFHFPDSSLDSFVIGEKLLLKSRVPGFSFISDVLTVLSIHGYSVEEHTGLPFARLTVSNSDGSSFTGNFFTLGSYLSFKSSLDSVPYDPDILNHIRDNFYRVTFPYSLTVHSAQGCSIPHVFFDSSQIAGSPSQHSLFYVASSRSSCSLNLVPMSPGWCPKSRKSSISNSAFSQTLNLWKSTFDMSHQNSRFLPYSVNGYSQRELIHQILLNDLSSYSSLEDFKSSVLRPLKETQRDWNKMVVSPLRSSGIPVWEFLVQHEIDPSSMNSINSFLLDIFDGNIVLPV